MVVERRRVLVVGCGSIGQRHARLLGERKDVEVWLCDARPEGLEAAAAAVPEARRFTDYGQALGEGPDAVLVCTPNDLHRSMAVAAAEAGCDVLCEKPLADNVEDSRAVRDAVRGTDGAFRVGYMWRCFPAIERMKQMVADGEMGNLVGGRAMVGSYYTLMCAKTPYRLREENAIIIDYTHQLDYLRLLFGEMESVQAASASLGDLEMVPNPNVFSTILSYASGALVQFHVDYVQHPQRYMLELYGDRKTICHDFHTGEMRIFERERDGYCSEYYPFVRDEIYRVQIDRFLSGQLDEPAPLADADDGVAAMEAAEACIRAAREGRAVRLEEVAG